MHTEEVNDIWKRMQTERPRLQSVALLAGEDGCMISIPYFHGSAIVGRFSWRDDIRETLEAAIADVDDRILRMVYQSEPMDDIIQSTGGESDYFTLTELLAICEHEPNTNQFQIYIHDKIERIRRIEINYIEYWVYYKMIIKPCATVWSDAGYKVVRNGEEYFLRKAPHEQVIDAGYNHVSGHIFRRDNDVVTIQDVKFDDGRVKW